MVPLLRLTLEYDGSEFAGWAAQPGRRTVEGVLGEALTSTYLRWLELGVAGRTDAGVHATGQVASVRSRGRPAAGARGGGDQRPASGRRLGRRSGGGAGGVSCPLLRPLPLVPLPDLAAAHPLAVRADAGRGGFPRPLDEAAACRVGPARGRRARLPRVHAHRRRSTTSSSAPSTPAPGSGTRDVLALTITADSFLRHMVRTLVGTMLEQEPGRSSACSRKAADGGRHDRAAVGPLPRAGRVLTPSAGAGPSAGSIEPMRYGTVLFDLDGTLIDSGEVILASFRHATRDGPRAGSSRTRS